MSTTSRGRLTVLLAAGGLSLAGLAAGPALVGTADAAPALPTGTTAVTLLLKAPHPAALAKLAGTPVASRQARLAQLAKLVPSQASRDMVAATLTAEGLTLEHETAWSVTAGGPSLTVGTLFGSLPTGAGVAHALTTGALPRVPASLTSLVSGAFRTTGGPAAFSARATSDLDGTDFRNADTPARVAPSTGKKDAGVTVATLQLSAFPSSDLTHYASTNKIADPVASGAYKGVTVDGGPSTMDSAGENSIEVDLDQESILSTAPTAHQHAYFAPNTNAGFSDVFANVYDDVVGNSMATSPDPHLVALSSSWGECEGETTAKVIKMEEPVIESVVAAGVTIFASSGDDGIYDCRSVDGTGDDNSQADVDFPASSPVVVSSGGSNLSAATSAANTGTNWTEKTWSCATPSACQNSNTGTGGGGGGASGSAFGHAYAADPSNIPPSPALTADFKGFGVPVWQKRTLRGIYAKATTRLVPDIAADADPATGFNVYTTLNTGVTGTSLGVGGTSLASPISAAQLANTLADAGHTSGVGDIHPAIYSGYFKGFKLPATSKLKPVRDITSGQIGANADKGSDPSVTAAKGFDTTSGIGGVLWSAMDPFLFDKVAPTAKGTAFKHHAKQTTKKVSVKWQWYSRAGKDTLVFDTTTVKIRKVGSKVALFKLVGSTRYNGSKTLTLPRGASYVMTVVTTDIGGHVSKVSTTKITLAKALKAHHQHHHHAA